MNERTIKSEIKAPVETVYHWILHFSDLKIFGYETIAWIDPSSWMELCEGTVERYCKIDVDRINYSVNISVSDSLNTASSEDIYSLHCIGITKDSSKLVVRCKSKDNVLANIGFYIRRYSIETSLKKIVNEIKKRSENT